MIISFSDKETEKLFVHEKSKRFGNIARVAFRKLAYVNREAALADLSVPPANRLEALKGDLKGFHSIRINEQWRIIFRWTAKGAEDVAIVDYH